MSAKRYDGERVAVTFDAARCLHAAECVRGLPSVFDTSRRPWITPDGAEPDAVAEVVRRCPSGALHYENDSAPEQPARPTVIDARASAPLFVRGELLLRTGAGELAETRAALCRCGSTGNAPFCDASGDCTGWREPAS